MLELELADDGSGWYPGQASCPPGLGYTIIEALASQLKAKLEVRAEGGIGYFVVLPLG